MFDVGSVVITKNDEQGLKLSLMMFADHLIDLDQALLGEGGWEVPHCVDEVEGSLPGAASA